MNSKKERHMIGEKDLPIVLVHGTMGKSEDWSRVVEELSRSRSVIRPNYIEQVAGAQLKLNLSDPPDDQLRPDRKPQSQRAVS
jgi:hypothetical protein